VIKSFAENGEKFDFIFMDAAKAQYIVWLPDIIKMLPKGAVLFSDNILQDGRIIESRYQVERRDRTIHSRMREYLFELKHNELLETAILTDGDGISISVRR
jgi:predicted O-methyltransferase YrrM